MQQLTAKLNTIVDETGDGQQKQAAKAKSAGDEFKRCRATATRNPGAPYPHAQH